MKTPTEVKELLQAACDASRNAYAPYSNFHVGSAVQTVSGRVFVGCNVENASYGLCICAERTAICKMISEGEREIDTIVVACNDGGTPCGACRQFMAEFGRDFEVIVVDLKSAHLLGTDDWEQAIRRRYTIRDLLPDAFELNAKP